MPLRSSFLSRSAAKISGAPFSHTCSSVDASAEIFAYIAARDMSVAEAERLPNDTTLNRAFLANQMVENCLRPARSPYQAQSLAEAEAARERKRCEAAHKRIAQLRACVATAA